MEHTVENVIQSLCEMDEETQLPILRAARGKSEWTMDSYETLRTMLSDEQKILLDKMVEEFQAQHLDDLDLYYELGFKKGFSLSQQLKTKEP